MRSKPNYFIEHTTLNYVLDSVFENELLDEDINVIVYVNAARALPNIVND